MFQNIVNFKGLTGSLQRILLLLNLWWKYAASNWKILAEICEYTVSCCGTCRRSSHSTCCDHWTSPSIPPVGDNTCTSPKREYHSTLSSVDHPNPAPPTPQNQGMKWKKEQRPCSHMPCLYNTKAKQRKSAHGLLNSTVAANWQHWPLTVTK